MKKSKIKGKMFESKIVEKLIIVLLNERKKSLD